MTSKSPEAFRTISEVADWLGVPTHVLRFWESRFAQVKPVKRAGGRRYYRPADMALLGGIKKLLHDDGMTIRGVQKLLREEGVKHVSAMAPSLESDAMRDVTPSNVVSLEERAANASGQSGEAVEEAELVTPESEPEAEPEAAPALQPEPEPEPELAPEPAVEAVEAVEPEPVPKPQPAAAETGTGPETGPEVGPEARPAVAAATEPEPMPQDSPDLPGFETAGLPDSPESLELFAHDADIAAPEPAQPRQEPPTPEPPAAEPPAPQAPAPQAPEQEPPAPESPTPQSPEPQSPAPAAPARPPMGDISHIPDDPPPEDDETAPVEPGLLAMLAAARRARSAPANKVGLTVIIERLTALRQRMERGRHPGPSA